MNDQDLHEIVLGFGKHAGERLVNVPLSYVKRMANMPDHRFYEEAKREMKRRGTVTPQIEISNHAIDRASQSCGKIWWKTRRGDERNFEGIYSWLHRVALEALEKGQNVNGGKITHAGMDFAFDQAGHWPVLKTVNRSRKNGKGR